MAKEPQENEDKRVVPGNNQTAPNQVDKDSGDSVQANPSDNETKVTQHLDRDPNDPRNAAPTPNLPSMDDPSQQGPEHGRVGNDNDQSAEGQDFVDLDKSDDKEDK